MQKGIFVELAQLINIDFAGISRHIQNTILIWSWVINNTCLTGKHNENPAISVSRKLLFEVCRSYHSGVNGQVSEATSLKSREQNERSI